MSPPLDDDGPALHAVDDWFRERAESCRIPGGKTRPSMDADAQEPAALSAEPFEWVEPELIPPRRWLLGTVALRAFISLLVAPGGHGKTTLGIGFALSVASGRNLLGEHVFEPAGAWVFNLEDPRVEMQRRITAAMLHHGLGPEDVAGRLFVNSGRDRPLVIARKAKDGTTILFPDKPRLVEEAKRVGIGLIVADPFVACHKLEENSNPEMNAAASAWAQVATEADCAVLLVHHTRKGGVAGQAADIESSRGAKALSDAARVGLTLAGMGEDEAKGFGIPPEDRGHYIRVDDAKANLTPKAAKAKWYRLHSIALGNRTPQYPNGDHVQAIERWSPPKPFADLTNDAIHACLDAIEAGPAESQRYGASKRGRSKRYVGPLIERMLGKNPTQAKEILEVWLETGLLVEGEYFNSETRSGAKGLYVDNSKRPSR